MRIVTMFHYKMCVFITHVEREFNLIVIYVIVVVRKNHSLAVIEDCYLHVS